eukprot:m51a1_g9704 hypothetical protein (561) ;mRNA; r:1389612-1391483
MECPAKVTVDQVVSVVDPTASTPASKTETPPEKMTLRLGLLSVWIVLFPFSVMFVEMCLVPALPKLQIQFSDNEEWIPWILSAYNITGAIWVSVSGSLSDIFGPKWVLVVSMCIYMAGQVIAALSNNIFVLIAGRALQGFGDAAAELGYTIVNGYLPKQYKDLMLSLVSGVFCLGMSIGLIGGAGAIEKTKWNNIFWITFPIIAVVTICFIVTMPGGKPASHHGAHSSDPEAPKTVEMTPAPAATTNNVTKVVATTGKKAEAAEAEEGPQSVKEFDFAGIAILTVGIVTLLMGLTFSESRGWKKAETLALTIVGTLLLLGLIGFEFLMKKPLIPVRLLMKRDQLMLSFVSFFIGLVMFSLFQMLPYLYSSPFLNVGATRMLKVGAYMLPFGLVSLLAAFVVVGLKRYIGYPLVMVGTSVCALISVGLYIRYHHTVAQVVVLNIFFGFGLGGTMISVMNMVSEISPPRVFGAISGADCLLQMLGGSLGPVFVTLVLNKNKMETPVGKLYLPKAFENAFIFLTCIIALSVICCCVLPKVTQVFFPQGREDLAKRRQASKSSN